VATLRDGRTTLSLDLGWNLEMVKWLEGLKVVLGDEPVATAQMNLLLDRLSGLRKQWETQKPK
jgi:hypothetical protein